HDHADPDPDRRADALDAVLGLPAEPRLPAGGALRARDDPGRDRAEHLPRALLRALFRVDMSGLSIAGIHKSFGPQPVLTGVDLATADGSFTAILGASGSGKTTLLRILAGFERPDRGTIAIGDAVVDDAGRHTRPEERRIGYVPQEGSLFPHLTV